MDTLNIALLQIAPCGTLDENLEKGITSCREAKSLGADIAKSTPVILMWSAI